MKAVAIIGANVGRAAPAVFLLAALLFSAAPSAAQDACPAAARQRLGGVTISNMHAFIDAVRRSPDEVRDLQQCLIVRGCYEENPKKVDGIVGVFTTAAIETSARGRCRASERAQPRCGEGGRLASWQLTAERIQQLKPPESDQPPAGVTAQAPAPSSAGAPAVVTAASFNPAQPPSVTGTSGATPSPASQTPPAGQTPSERPPEGTPSPAAPLPAEADRTHPPHGSAVVPPPRRTALSGDLFKRLHDVQGIDYPSWNLFSQALHHFTTHPEATGTGAPLSASARASLERELGRPEIQRLIEDQACQERDDEGPEWAAAWHETMVYPLSNKVYGFWLGQMRNGGASARPPQARKNADPVLVDFGVLERVGWFGVTYSDEGTLQLRRAAGARTARQVELARRFRTAVDLVVYKNLTERQWLDSNRALDSGHLRGLSDHIVAEVARQVPGFLNRVQNRVLPDLLASPTTAWDGVTIYFEHYPWTDQGALRNFVHLIRDLRMKLTSVERADPSESHLALNIVVPYEAFVPADAELEATPADIRRKNVAIAELAKLVPRHTTDFNVSEHADGGDNLIDSLIVFLPQPTSEKEQKLRQAVEIAFNGKNVDADQKGTRGTVSLEAWRFQMLRKLVTIVFPGTWTFPGEYAATGAPESDNAGSSAGRQFEDDMIYAKDNFGGVGFWPLPAYGASVKPENQELRARTRAVFGLPKSDWDWIRTKLAPFLITILRPPTANFVTAWRRELFLLVEVIFLLLAAYQLLAFWVVELREPLHTKKWLALLYWGLATLMSVIIILLCVFDRELMDWALLGFFVVVIGILGLLLLWRRYRTVVERDLP